jgi:putative endonuclease
MKDFDKQEWIDSLKVGDIVCDCRFLHRKIIGFTISGSGDKHLDLQGGMSCSARHCCDPADHPKHWFVYILKCFDGTLYTGITNDIEKRLYQHNNSKRGAKYTRSRRPVKLLKSFLFTSKSEALKKEYRIKQLSREEKLKL